MSSEGARAVQESALGFAIVGTGVVARYHAQGIARTAGARLVSVCRSNPERAQLAQQHRRVQMRIVSKPLSDVAAERLQRTRPPPPLSIALSAQPRPYRLAVTAGMARDRADRPAPAMQRNDLHHVLP